MYERLGNTRLFVPFPPSHMAGLLYSLATTVFADSTIILPPPTPLTADLTAKVHEAADVEFSVLPPAIITELSNREDCLENLKKLKGLQFVGGPLAESTGTFMRQYTTLHNTIGATEYFTVPFRAKATEDWAWFHFDSENGGVQFRLEDNGLYEMVIVRDDRLDLQQAIFVTFPDIDEYHTKDLFAPHPSKPDHWTYKGRLDDVIVFSSGEKFNPVTTEGIINSCPEVSGSVVVGQGRFQAAVLIEGRQTPSTKEEQEDLRQKVLPYIEKANKTAVGTGRIVPELVDLVRPGKPLPRAGKYAIQRD